MPIDTAIQDVTLFGADSRGKRDSTSAIQRAVDTAAALGGGSIRLPAGRFRITAPIDLRNKRAIQFQGVSGGAGSDDGTRIVQEAPGSHAFLLERSKGCQFRDLFVERPEENRDTLGDGFHATFETSDCRWDDCYVRYFDHAMFLQGSWQNYIRGCLLGYSKIGAKVDTAGGPSNDTKFDGCLLAQCTKYELEINANTVYVVGCDFESSVSQLGIFGRFGRDCVIANCSYIRGASLALERMRFVGNGVAAPNTHGIVLVRAHNAIVSQNVIWRAAGHGFKFFESADVLVDGNQIVETGFNQKPGFSGISIQDASSRANIRNNIVRRIGQQTAHAVQILDAASVGNVVWGNDFRDGHSGSAILDRGTGSILNNNLL